MKAELVSDHLYGREPLIAPGLTRCCPTAAQKHNSWEALAPKLTKIRSQLLV